MILNINDTYISLSTISNVRCFDPNLTLQMSPWTSHHLTLHPPFIHFTLFLHHLLLLNLLLQHQTLLNLLLYQTVPSFLNIYFLLSLPIIGFNTKKHWSHFCQPIWIHRSHICHILFRCHHQFMIHHIIRSIT